MSVIGCSRHQVGVCRVPAVPGFGGSYRPILVTVSTGNERDYSNSNTSSVHSDQQVDVMV